MVSTLTANTKNSVLVLLFIVGSFTAETSAERHLIEKTGNVQDEVLSPLHAFFNNVSSQKFLQDGTLEEMDNGAKLVGAKRKTKIIYQETSQPEIKADSKRGERMQTRERFKGKTTKDQDEFTTEAKKLLYTGDPTETEKRRTVHNGQVQRRPRRQSYRRSQRLLPAPTQVMKEIAKERSTSENKRAFRQLRIKTGEAYKIPTTTGYEKAQKLLTGKQEKAVLQQFSEEHWPSELNRNDWLRDHEAAVNEHKTSTRKEQKLTFSTEGANDREIQERRAEFQLSTTGDEKRSVKNMQKQRRLEEYENTEEVQRKGFSTKEEDTGVQMTKGQHGGKNGGKLPTREARKYRKRKDLKHPKTVTGKERMTNEELFQQFPELNPWKSNINYKLSDQETISKKGYEDKASTLRERTLTVPSEGASEIQESTHEEHRGEFPSGWKGNDMKTAIFKKRRRLKAVQRKLFSTREENAEMQIPQGQNYQRKPTREAKNTKKVKDPTHPKEVAEIRRKTNETNEGSETRGRKLKIHETKILKVQGRGSLIGLSGSFHAIPSTPASHHRPIVRTSFTRDVRRRQRREEPQNATRSIAQESPTVKANSSSITCDDSRSCRGRCMKERDPGPAIRTLQCFCDKDCEMFQDCCADYDDYCSTHNVTSPTVPDVHWKCVHKGGLGIRTREIAGIWMISSCPRDWPNNKVRSMCVNTLEPSRRKYKQAVPVTIKNGTTYKNFFCAQCNGVKGHELTYYETECEKQDGKNCTAFKWKPWEGTRRRYCLKLESACSSSNVSLDVRHHCQNGTFRVVHRAGRNVKNQFCLKCSGAAFDSDCGPIGSVDTAHVMAGGRVVIAFFFETPITPITPIKVHFEIEMLVFYYCPAGEMFDHNLDTCRPGIISPPTNANLNKFAVAMWIKPWNTLRNQSVFTKQDVLDALRTVFGVSNIYIQRYSDHSIVSFELGFIGGKQILRDIGLAPDRLLNLTKEISIKIADVDFHIYRVTSRLLACVDIQEFGANEYTVLQISPPAVYINKSRETFYSYQYFANKTKTKDDRVIPIGNILVCRLHLTANCSGAYIPLKEHEYVVFPNGSLYRNISRESFSRYDVRNKTAWICTNWSTSYNKTREIMIHYSNIINFVLRILSCIGLSLSIFSLVLFLLTYSLFSELRTLPGINVMNLSVSLLLLHSLWFATSETHVPLVCSIIAALLHYVALVSFTWMSIIAFHTWRIFSTLRVPRKGPQHDRVNRTKVLRFMAVGWIPALIFVIFCVVLDQTQTFTVGYGGENICFINNDKANKFLFVLPTAISIAFNAIFFVKTVVILRKTKKKTRAVTARHSKDRKSFWVYVRLASLMGFTWIFRFLAQLISEYLLYPFVIFTTLQGVYIAAAFVFKTRVKELYIQRLCSNTNNELHNPGIETPHSVVETKPRRKCKDTAV